MHRTIRLTAITLGLVGLLTACNGKSGDTPTPPSPSSSGSSPATSAAQGDGPKVPSALPTKDILADPCSALSASDVDQVGLTGKGTPSTQSGDSICTWKSSATELNSVSIGPLPQNPNGISDIYAGKAKAAYFEPTTVAGYPGVFTSIADLRKDGNCQLWIGVSDQLAVAVGTGISVGTHKSDPCSVATNVGTAMIQHLKGAA